MEFSKSHSRMPMHKEDSPFYGLKAEHFIISAVIFVLLAALVVFNVYLEGNRIEEDLKTQVARKANTLLASLERELNANVFLANGLVAHVMSVPDLDKEKTHIALKALFGFGRHLRNIGIAPDNRISQVFPLEGNQAAIGLNYPEIPSQWPAVKRAIDSGGAVLAGPVRLLQGGSGLISRTPVFLEDGQYWGILSLVLDMSSLLEGAGILPEKDGVRFALRGKDALGERGEVFFGDAALFEATSIKLSLAVPGGTWQMAALPAEGWNSGKGHLVVFGAIGFMLSALLTLSILIYQGNRVHIITSKNRLRAILDTTPDGVIVITDKGIVCEFNPGAENLFGYPSEEMIGSSVNKLMVSTDAMRHDGYVQDSHNAVSRLMTEGRQVSGRRKSGEQFPIEVTVGEAFIGQNRVHVGVVRDITKRKAIEDKLRELAVTDNLTGALNRHGFEEIAENAFMVSKRYSRPLSVLMIDADHFKGINDSYGHDAGDKVLIRFSSVVRETLRSTDVFCRYGGEEFLALLPETTFDEAAILADRVLSDLRETEVRTNDDETVRFTVSIGVASLTPDVQDFSTVIQRADDALYKAKSEGRDRWCAG